jgi:hypothetical protein
MPAHAPIEVDALSPAFHQAYRRAGGTPEQPDARAAWRAFCELALRPVVPGDAAPEVDEDFFMDDVWPGGEYRPEFPSTAGSDSPTESTTTSKRWSVPQALYEAT